MNDERRHRKATQQRSPVVAFAAKSRSNGSTGLTLGPRRREHLGQRLIGKPGGVHRARVRALNSRIRREQCFLIDALENRAIGWPESRQRLDEQILLPVAERTNAVDEDESSDRVLIAFCGKHGKAAAPGVAKHVPLRQPEGIADGRKISSIVFDASTACSRWSLRCTSAALIVQDQLPVIGERSERRPQQVVIEEKPAVHADKRNGTGFLRGEKHGKVEPACVNDAPN